ncbi:UbiX family flavin prenyltransferase [Paenibacillus thailandensis]|uniref:Flavin prenyltransferase UbiX n=1 Tax=Paenibacillus thailandensis TaxID=393250 RepID=A0ABW5R0J1_9BACL
MIQPDSKRHSGERPETAAVRRWAVGITGASGSVYGIRLVQELLRSGITVHLVITEAGWRVLKEELDWETAHRQAALKRHFEEAMEAKQLIYHPNADIGASIASGSYRMEGMAVMPCSMGTLASIAHGISDDLMTRAADVMIKEGRKLLLVPRETPLHAIHLENMLKLSRLGVRMIPAMPAFYYKPRTMDDMIDFLVGKVLDNMDIPHELYRRWGDEQNG